MTFSVIIPARYASTRFPGKPLADLADKPMVVRVCEQAAKSGAAAVHVATDDRRIAQAVERAGFAAVMTSAAHASGTDRVAEAAKKLKVDEISGVIAAPDSLHIVKLREHRPASQAPYEQVKTILEMKLSKEVRAKKLQEWVTDLKRGAKIEIIQNGETAAK